MASGRPPTPSVTFLGSTEECEMGLAFDILDNDVRKKIAADDAVLKEARDRRDLVAESAMEIEGALRWFRSGSVAHAMVNKPVSDADSGIVLDRRHEKYT